MMTLITILGLLLLAAIAIGVFFINTQRQLVRLDEMCKNAQSQIMQNRLLSDVLGRINVVYERYPQLKASELYVNTQHGQKQYEEQVRMARMIYNDTATKMNALVRQWPTSVVASLLHFGVKDYLTIDDEQKLGYPS